MAGPRPVVTTEDTRKVAYLAMQCGCFGYTYGANGIWQGSWAPEEIDMQKKIWHDAVVRGHRSSRWRPDDAAQEFLRLPRLDRADSAAGMRRLPHRQ